MKLCSRCGVQKPLDQYVKNGRSRDGLDYWCNGCRKNDRDAFRARNLEAIRLRDRSRPWNRAPEGPDKLCPSCNRTLPLAAYHRRRNGVQPRCKECRRSDDALVKRRQYESTPRAKERLFTASLRRYGLTLAGYHAMVDAQGGKCLLCGTADLTSSPGGRLHVDHCHDTGRVRGLLCHQCNSGLGLFKERAPLLRAAADYLERPPSTTLV